MYGSRDISKIAIKVQTKYRARAIISRGLYIFYPIFKDHFFVFNPIPTSQGRNQPLYERHVTKSGRSRVKEVF